MWSRRRASTRRARCERGLTMSAQGEQARVCAREQHYAGAWFQQAHLVGVRGILSRRWHRWLLCVINNGRRRVRQLTRPKTNSTKGHLVPKSTNNRSKSFHVYSRPYSKDCKVWSTRNLFKSNNRNTKTLTRYCITRGPDVTTSWLGMSWLWDEFWHPSSLLTDCTSCSASVRATALLTARRNCIRVFVYLSGVIICNTKSEVVSHFSAALFCQEWIRG